MLHNWIPVILARLLSVIQASSLRDRYYTLQNRNEILETAFNDIERISKSSVTIEERHKLIVGIIENTKKTD